MHKALQLVALFIASSIYGRAQDVAKVEKSKTKLETFIAQDGAVIIQGFSTAGTIKGLYSSSVTVKSKEIVNAGNGQKIYGVTLEVKEASRIERDHTSYIDYEEIESLVKGLDYVSKIDKTATKLDDFQADYKTKGDLKVSTFSSSSDGGKVLMAVQSGSIGSTTAYFNSEYFKQIRELIVAAKQKLDSIK